jgi:nitrite reductase/ring-hydroxylating ferredoxin subunit
MPMTRKVPVAKVGEIAPGRTKTFKLGHQLAIAYNDAGSVKAYLNSCTHMGGPVELAPDGTTFRCRWHQAEFSAASGEALEGQAPKNTRLKPIELTEEAGTVFALWMLPDDPFSF